MQRSRVPPVFLLALALAWACGPPADPETAAAQPDPHAGAEATSRGPEMTGAALESDGMGDLPRLIRSYRTIPLTSEQAAIKDTALRTIPAPCCSEFSLATCCCPCNLAKAAWGLAHHLIAEQDAGVNEVREAVQIWLDEANPDGFAGHACFTPGGCLRPVHQDGCGGMDEASIAE